MTKKDSLQVLFERLRTKYFPGKLRQYTVLWADFPEIPYKLGHCDSRWRIIRIRRGLTGDKLIATLLHEMNHVGGPYHGKKFRAGIERLVKMGAPVSEEDRSPYLSATQMVVNDIDSLALEHSELSWATARKLLAREQGMTEKAFACRFWWADKRWKRQIKNFR